MALGSITLEIKDSNNNILGSYTSTPPDQDLTEALTYFAAATNYSATLPDGTDNPESMGDYMIRKMKEYVESVVVSYAANAAAEQARRQVLAQGSDYL